jgi:hypothetical protein
MAMMRGLYVHCGAALVERDVLQEMHTPDSTRTHVPIPHIELVDRAVEGLGKGGWQVKAEAHATSHEHNRYFGVLELVQGASSDLPAPITEDEFAICVGIRNSHDKSFPVALCAGTSVFVCDNLAFSGEVKIARKHTTHVRSDLDALMSRAMARVQGTFVSMEVRAEAYKNHTLTDDAALRFILEAHTEHKFLKPSKLGAVVQEWREPAHTEFEDRNAWSLFNSITEVDRPTSAAQMLKLTDKTAPLYSAMDRLTGVIAKIDALTAEEEENIIDV